MSNNPLYSRGMLAVLTAQFLSALADNALLFAAIAMLRTHAAPDWQMPLLQEGFVISFIVLSPFVGPLSDAWPKGQILFISNLVKFVGALAMMMGLHPLLAYTLVGIGAAPYSPAKYGILSELVSADKLVKANGLMEGSTIVAILLGSIAGGKLVDISLTVTLNAICFCYVMAAGANLLIPRLPVAHPLKQCSPIVLMRDFWASSVLLFRDKDARFSLLGTSVFWGTGSTLRLLLVAWVPVALGINGLSISADLNGAVAIGIALGAVMASGLVSLNNVNRVIPPGILLGVVIIGFAHVTHLTSAILMLILVGILGGFYIVPLNALLQERGEESVGSGHAVAVQSFVENCAMLGFVGIYIAMSRAGMPVVQSATIFGSVVLIGVSLLAIFRLKKIKN
jgi:MFS transporter, LPLT family, lysophospholipid transporter